MKKTTAKRKISNLWFAAQHQIHRRCLVCWNEPVEIHHLIRRGNSVAWDRLNGIGLCEAHHRTSSTLSAHGTPDKFRQWLAAKYPDLARWVEANEHRIEPSVDWEEKLREVESWALPILEEKCIK